MGKGLSPRVKALVRASVADLEPYDPGFSPVAINLSANENTHGMPEEVRRDMSVALSHVVENRYPAPLATDLREALAEWHQVTPQQVLVSNGGDEALFNLFLAFGGAGHKMVNCPPTFSVYRLYAEMVETPVVDVPRDPETLLPDIDAIVEAAKDAHLVVLTSPNNPTGDCIARADMARICEACPGIVLADEAYGEFAPAGTSSEPLLDEYDNLVVLHTFSKAFCLAGGRIGYLLGAPDVLAALSAVRQPYSVNSFSQAAALVAVHEMGAFEPVIEDIVHERGWLASELSKLPQVKVWPSSANFLCVRMPEAGRKRAELRDEYSILVRDFSTTPGLEDCLRITVGTHEENEAVVSAIAELLAKED